jgi:hypothetical protein
MVQLYPLGREGFADGSYNWAASNIKAMLVKSTYTFNAAHKFVTDLGAVDNGRSANLASKTQALGLCTAANSSLVATAAVASSAIVIYYDTGSDATSRLIAYIDGIQQLIIPVTYAGAQTTLAVEAALGNMANGTVLGLISGSGPATITLSGAYTAGQFTLSVSSTGSGITAGAVYGGAETGNGLPMTPAAGGTVNLVWDPTNGIFTL